MVFEMNELLKFKNWPKYGVTASTLY